MTTWEELESLIRKAGFDPDKYLVEETDEMILEVTKSLLNRLEDREPVACAVYKKGDDRSKSKPIKLYKSEAKARGYLGMSRVGKRKETNEELDNKFDFVLLYP